MLVLTRKLLEKIYIGDDICVTIVRLEGNQVRLGIDAPREVPVVRAELMATGPVPEPGQEPGPGLRTAAAPGPGPIRIRPTATTRGSDSRRPGPSR